MLFNAQTFALAALISTLANARPLEAPRPRDIVVRAKSYDIINVDGGSSTEAPPPATTTVEETKTIEVVNPGPTVTQEVTSVVVQPAPAPAPTSSAGSSSTSSPSSTSTPTPTISSSTSSSSSMPTETPKPIVVTVTVPASEGPTEYYDNGMWHTSYRIKSVEAAVVTPTFWTTSSTALGSSVLPVMETPTPSYNQTIA